MTFVPGDPPASGISQALPCVAGSLAVSAGLTRVMALPGVQRLLPSWLRTDSTPVNVAAFHSSI
ncbi:hypothetical protein [Planotetraspora silvatica]|nr:hypothetical protein [Planotetraspora silvatica]